MKYNPIIIMALFIIISCAKKESVDIMKVHSFMGEVTITSQQESKMPAVGNIINANDTIETGAQSIIDIVYRDSSIIRIHENSSVLVSSLMKAETDDVVLTLKEGKVFATLGRLRKGDEFAVKSKTAIAAVRGTSFRVAADEKSSSVDVIEGSVIVNPVKNDTVIKEVEVVVEENKTVAIDTATVETIVQKIEEKKAETATQQEKHIIIEKLKETIKPTELPKATIKEIKQEVLTIPAAAGERDVKKQLDKLIEAEEEAKKREQEQIKVKKEIEERALLKKQKEREAQLLAEKIEKDKLEKEKAEREKAEKEQKRKEDRVKNIPTL